MGDGRRDVEGPSRAGGADWSYGPQTYGDRMAGEYDAWYARVDEAMIDTLAELAGEGCALELGIGTGRVALPLAARGVEVHGIDASRAMVEKLQAKPGGADVPVTLGDFAELDLGERRFSIVFVVFNTFLALTTQEAQVACFRSVARHLAPGGVFAIDTFVPDLTRFTRGQHIGTTEVASGHVVLETSVHDAANQRVRSQHVVVAPEGTRLFPVEIRYVWPSEMDLMARLAGMRLRARWSSWSRAPFAASSGSQVAVYERDGA